jgi:hypothetical protein
MRRFVRTRVGSACRCCGPMALPSPAPPCLSLRACTAQSQERLAAARKAAAAAADAFALESDVVRGVVLGALMSLIAPTCCFAI